jgi:pantothenate kinase
MIPFLTQPIQHIVTRLEITASRWLIGMAGLPGSGKSTLAQYLAEEVNAATASDTMIALGMDGFHYTKAELQQFPDPDEAFARRGAPWTFDTTALYQRLAQVHQAAGRTVITWPGFEHAVGDPIADAAIIPASTRIVLVEGLYLLHQANGWQHISQSFDERWYLDTPIEVAMDRLALRHMQAWGISRSTAEHRIATNDRINAGIVAASAQFADWWVASLKARPS